MKIKTKILIPSLVAVAMMLVLGIVSFLGLRSMQQTLDLVANSGMQHIEILSSSRSQLLEANVGAYRLFSTIANMDEAKIKTETATVVGHVDEAIKLLQAMSERSDVMAKEKEELATLTEPIAKYRKTIAQAIDMAEVDLGTGAGMMHAADKRFLDIDAKLDTMLDEQKGEANKEINAAISGASKAVATDIGIFVIGVLAAIAIARIQSGKIIAPLLEAIRVAASIASGNLTNTIDTRGDDETGDLLRALSGMQTNLRDLLGQVAANARLTSESCQSMSSSLAQISNSVAGQNDATSAVAAAVEQMSVSVTNINDSASQALQANQESSSLATEGVTVIQNAFDEMSRIVSTVRESAEIVERVGQQSNEISSIVSVIREVADQTNLLALNAAIEAARAGEAGRGFAVVADEVRKLAEKTTSSAEEITRMIDGIQGSSGHAVKNIHEVVTQMEVTAQNASSAREAIERIHQSSEQSEGYAREISSALGEQSQTSQLIAQQVEDITRMSDENAQSVASVGTAMQKLEDEARVLEKAAAHFKV